MLCGACINSGREALVELLPSMVCPVCHADYSAYRRTLPTLKTKPASGYDVTAEGSRYNALTRKLIPTGAANRDRLVAARLALRSHI